MLQVGGSKELALAVLGLSLHALQRELQGPNVLLHGRSLIVRHPGMRTSSRDRSHWRRGWRSEGLHTRHMCLLTVWPRHTVPAVGQLSLPQAALDAPLLVVYTVFHPQCIPVDVPVLP